MAERASMSANDPKANLQIFRMFPTHEKLQVSEPSKSTIGSGATGTLIQMKIERGLAARISCHVLLICKLDWAVSLQRLQPGG